MKRRFFLSVAVLLTGLAIPCMLFSVEVSEKQDIAIFGLTYYSYEVPEEVLAYIDSSINHQFIGLKRFNVLGYANYRLESGDIDEFIARIKELQVEKVKKEGTYDEKFGTIVIKGEDFDRIVGSFLVVLPSLSNYGVTVEETEAILGTKIYMVPSYSVEVVIDIVFVNVGQGTMEESIRIYGTGRDRSFEKANREAVDSAMSSLSYRIKQIEMFRIKSGVIQVRGDRVFFELGTNIGVRPGDEYEVLTKHEVGKTGRIVEMPTGLVRVRKVYPDMTEGVVIIERERITEGDQLVEVARLGGNLSFYTGIMKVDIPDMNYDIILGGDLATPPFTSYFSISLNQRARQYVPLAGISFEKNIGYRLKGILDGTALLNFPLLGGIGEIGVGTSIYKRRMSVEFAALAGILYMTTFQKSLTQNGLSPILIIEGTPIDFLQNPVLNIYGVGAGVKGKASIDFRIKPGASLKAGVAYRLYTPIKDWRLHIEETSGDDKESVDIGSDSENIENTERSEGMKQVNISGYEINFAFTLRF